ncbi:hypothetical protein PTKIN_Ptkin09bG0069100 [Pterospermum kingtungense]
MEINSHDQLDFEDFLILSSAVHGGTDNETATAAFSQNLFNSSHENETLTTTTSVPINGSCWQVPRSCRNDDKGCGNTKEKEDVGFKIAFRTKTDLEIMDDGYKWRKYGKKKVKNSPNPRNYYRCSTGGCMVKKRVEREREDPRFVITTYEGKHNHESLSPAPVPATCYTYTNNIIRHQP